MDLREQTASSEMAHAGLRRLKSVRSTSTAAAKARQRRLGAYYTPHSSADLMAEWVVRRADETILEPSFGSGVFIKAIDRAVESMALAGIQVTGVEIDQDVLQKLHFNSKAVRLRTIWSDFLETRLAKVDAIIGNPPYVRLRHLQNSQREKALCVAKRALGHEMATSGSLWMPFVLHALQSLRPNGRLALVLPVEFTYVKYALPLWRTLADSFDYLRVDRSKERLFPDVMQEVVILYADGYGGSTDQVDFKTFDSVSDQLREKASIERTLSVESIITGDRVFVKALLSDDLISLLDGLLPSRTLCVETMAKIRIGYVSGDKEFFHPDTETVDRYEISRQNIVRAITSTKSLARAGVTSSTVPQEDVSNLFLPKGDLSPSEAAYVRQGESMNVQKRFKCRIRKPWYAVPGVQAPDFLMSVFSERPLMILNDAGYAASNSLICGYVKTGFDAEAILTGWYTSLTLLQCEMEVHSLGGGVMVLIPGEANKIRLPLAVEADEYHLSNLGNLLMASRTEEAFIAGDKYVLENQLSMASSDIELVREGIETLKEWRTAHRS